MYIMRPRPRVARSDAAHGRFLRNEIKGTDKKSNVSPRSADDSTDDFAGSNIGLNIRECAVIAAI